MSKFAFTIGAMKEVCERCPNHDIERILDLFDEDDTVKRLDNMIWFIVTLSKWATFKEADTFDGALTEDEILKMDFTDLNDLFNEALASFNSDAKPETEVEPTKKTKAAPKQD